MTTLDEMDGLPDEWEAPPELRVPTPYPEVNLAITLLSCESIDFKVRAAIGRFVTEEATYDLWFIENERSAKWGPRRSALLRELPMEQTRLAYEAWQGLREIDQTNAPNEILRERRTTATAALTAALEHASETFAAVREGIKNID